MPAQICGAVAGMETYCAADFFFFLQKQGVKPSMLHEHPLTVYHPLSTARRWGATIHLSSQCYVLKHTCRCSFLHIVAEINCHRYD